MDKELLKGLKGVKFLSDTDTDLGQISTRDYGLNKNISGKYSGGIPIGGITQFIGGASTAKTVFLTNVLAESQSLGYYTLFVDAENALSVEFSTSLGLDAEKLSYFTPTNLEDAFDVIHGYIKHIREHDKKTPIVIGLDSLAVLPTKKQFNAESFEGTNMDGAHRALIIGSCLRKLNPILRPQKVAFIVINQIRTNVGQMFGNPDTPAAGGKSLEYYLSVNCLCVSNKTSDLLKNDEGEVIGIKGEVRNKKNKISMPFKTSPFKFEHAVGIDPYYGILDCLLSDGLVTKPKNNYVIGETSFAKKKFPELLFDFSCKDFDVIRELFNIKPKKKEMKND